MRVPVFVLAILLGSRAWGASKAEQDLKAQLALAQAQIVAAAKDKAALSAALAKLTIDGTARTAAITQASRAATRGQAATADAVSNASSDLQVLAENNALVAKQTADAARERAETAVAAAKAAETASKDRNTASLVLEAGTLLGLVLKFIYDGWMRTQDHRWAVQDAKDKAAAEAAHRNDVLNKLGEVKSENQAGHAASSEAMERLEQAQAAGALAVNAKLEHLSTVALDTNEALRARRGRAPKVQAVGQEEVK